MTALQTPAPDATAEEWGRLAVSIPGWRWMPGMYAVARLPRTGSGFTRISSSIPRWWLQTHDAVPDPDDPATEGCLLRMLGGGEFSLWATAHFDARDIGIGRACIAYAAANGRWPGGPITDAEIVG